MDIVGYLKKPIYQQSELLGELNRPRDRAIPGGGGGGEIGPLTDGRRDGAGVSHERENEERSEGQRLTSTHGSSGTGLAKKGSKLGGTY